MKHKEQKIQPEQQEENRIKKKQVYAKEPLGHLQTLESKGCQEEKRKNKKLNLFEKTKKESFPNLVREIDKSREHRESQRQPHQNTR